MTAAQKVAELMKLIRYFENKRMEHEAGHCGELSVDNVRNEIEAALTEALTKPVARTPLSDSDCDDIAFGYCPTGKIGELRDLIRATEATHGITQTVDSEIERAKAVDIAIRCGAISPEQKDARHFEITRIELWRLVQAARRAPVVPHGWKLVPELATNDMAHSGKEVDGRLSAFKYADAYKAMLAAAPKPPEANSPGFEGIKTESAPVELPEPDAYMDAEDEHRIGTSSDWVVTGDKRAPDDVALYTEQQVRELLACSR